MPPNTANPNGPQYGSGRRDDSSNGITLPTDFLSASWDSELARIGQDLNLPTISHRAARARGFAWGLRAADLINEDITRLWTRRLTKQRKRHMNLLKEGAANMTDIIDDANLPPLIRVHIAKNLLRVPDVAKLDLALERAVGFVKGVEAARL